MHACLKDRVVFITGCSAGIGAACARLFAQNNCKVIMTARRSDRLNVIYDEIRTDNPKTKAFCNTLDVRDRAAVSRLIEELPSEFKPIDILVNNAGLAAGLGPVSDTSDEQIDQMLDTNVKGLLNVTKAVLSSHMLPQNSGHIINIGSIAGSQTYPNGAVYCASKHAVHAISDSLRMELVNTPIRVTEISPGLVETEFSKVRHEWDEEKASKVYKGIEALKAEDIAELVVFAASRPSHVQLAEMIIFPTAQASANIISRRID